MLHLVNRSVVALVLLHVVPAVAQDDHRELVTAVNEAANHSEVGIHERIAASEHIRGDMKKPEVAAALKRADGLVLVNPQPFQRAISPAQIALLFTRMQVQGYTGNLGSFAKMMRRTNRDRVAAYKYATTYGLSYALGQLASQFRNPRLTPTASFGQGYMPLATIQLFAWSAMFPFVRPPEPNPVGGGCSALGLASKSVLLIGAALVFTGIGDVGFAEFLMLVGALGEIMHEAYC